MKMLTQRQEDALARHKKKGTHTRKHMEEMKKYFDFFDSAKYG